MFEEVPRERRGVARWLLAHSIGVKPVVVRPVVVRPFVLRPLAVGPFVLGGGLLLAAVGGSVAVAAAATVLTASAIGSDDVPPRPPHAAVAVSPSHPAPARPPAHQPATVPAPATAAERQPGPVPSHAAAPAATAGPASAHSVTAPASTRPASSPVRSSVPAVAPPVTGSPVPSPSSSGPLGNALIHVSGYDPATGRLAYQFAVADPHGSAGERYRISSPETFSAVLAPAASIVSGGTLCPPAGSACTPAQLIAAAGNGFFAEVAIDVTGSVRSVVEVAEQPETAELTPVPSASAAPAGRLAHPGGRPPAPSAGRARLSEPARSLST